MNALRASRRCPPPRGLVITNPPACESDAQSDNLGVIINASARDPVPLSAARCFLAGVQESFYFRAGSGDLREIFPSPMDRLDPRLTFKRLLRRRPEVEITITERPSCVHISLNIHSRGRSQKRTTIQPPPTALFSTILYRVRVGLLAYGRRRRIVENRSCGAIKLRLVDR